MALPLALPGVGWGEQQHGNQYMTFKKGGAAEPGFARHEVEASLGSSCYREAYHRNWLRAARVWSEARNRCPGHESCALKVTVILRAGGGGCQ